MPTKQDLIELSQLSKRYEWMLEEPIIKTNTDSRLINFEYALISGNRINMSKKGKIDNSYLFIDISKLEGQVIDSTNSYSFQYLQGDYSFSIKTGTPNCRESLGFITRGGYS